MPSYEVKVIEYVGKNKREMWHFPVIGAVYGNPVRAASVALCSMRLEKKAELHEGYVLRTQELAPDHGKEPADQKIVFVRASGCSLERGVCICGEHDGAHTHSAARFGEEKR